MSSAQVWTVIAGFLAILVAMSGLVLALVRAEIRELRAEIRGDLHVLAARFDAVEREVERLHERVYAGEPPAA